MNCGHLGRFDFEVFVNPIPNQICKSLIFYLKSGNHCVGKHFGLVARLREIVKGVSSNHRYSFVISRIIRWEFTNELEQLFVGANCEGDNHSLFLGWCGITFWIPTLKVVEFTSTRLFFVWT